MPVPEISLLFILLSIYTLVFIDQIIYFWLFFGKLAFYKPKKQGKKPLPVSVVICARDEYSNLERLLPQLLEQDYPDFEVVVVNDASNDDTIELLNDFKRKYPNLSIVNITQSLNFFQGKKFPLSLGIKSAKNELLLLTEAHCEPGSDQWLKLMTSAFTPNTDIVLGYGPLRPARGFLNTLRRFDTMQIAIQYLSFALMGKTFMGTGRNLAYRKSLFYKSKGFISQYKLQIGGDDDLFINRVATKTNTRIEILPESFMYSESWQPFSYWFRKKQQHQYISQYYKRGTRFLRGKFALSQFLFYALFATLLIMNYNIIIVLSLFALRLFSQLFITKMCMNLLSERKLLLISPLLELFLILLQIFVRVSNIFIKQNKWK